MNEPLHPSSLGPSSLGEILDRTAHLYRSRFLVFFGISVVPTAVVLVPLCCIFFLLAWLGSNKPNIAPRPEAALLAGIFLVVAGVVALAAYLGVAALAMAAMNHAVARAYLGEKTTIRDAYKAVWGRGWHYIGLLFLEGMVIGVAPMAVWIALLLLTGGVAALAQRAGMGGIASGALFGLVVVLVVVALVTYFFWMLLRLSLAFPACVIERIGAVAALKRSSSLSKGTRGRIFLLYLLAAALTWLLSLGVTVPLAIVAALIPAFSGVQHAQAAGMVMVFIIYGGSFAVQALTKPIYGIALTLFYYDQRIRQEGFDIEWLMQRAGLVVQPAPAPEAQPWQAAVPLTRPNEPTADPIPPQADEPPQSTEPPAISGEQV
jgi:hypothetical protein